MIIDPIRVGEEIRFVGRGIRRRVAELRVSAGATHLLQSTASGKSPAFAPCAGTRKGDPVSSTARGASAKQTRFHAVHVRSAAARLVPFGNGGSAYKPGASRVRARGLIERRAPFSVRSGG